MEMIKIILCCLVGSLFLSPASGHAARAFPFSAGDLRPYKTLNTWKDFRDRQVVKQGFDYSCGSSSLATLINLSFGENVSEGEIIQEILKRKNEAEQADIKKNGYSLLDLKEAAEAKGYLAVVYKLDVEQLFQLQGPVLVYFEPKGEKHFAVLKYVKGDRVYLADPSRGNNRLSIYRFKELWPGYILALDKK
jgi:uncharacterized protein